MPSTNGLHRLVYEFPAHECDRAASKRREAHVAQRPVTEPSSETTRCTSV